MWFGSATSSIMEKQFALCQNCLFYLLAHFVFSILPRCWIVVQLLCRVINTPAFMVNLWWWFFFSCSVFYCHTAFSHYSLLSAVAAQDQATAADRRRVGSINRNWTNYKADVLLYGSVRKVSGECLWYFHYLSLCACVFCFLKSAFRQPRLSESLASSSPTAMVFQILRNYFFLGTEHINLFSKLSPAEDYHMWTEVNCMIACRSQLSD